MKKIGIVGWNTGDNSFGITKAYAEYFSKFGEIVILGPSNKVNTSIDLLVLPGGLDIAPQSSGMTPSFYTSNTDVMKQYFFDVTLRQYIHSNIPIFGICLGFQQLCVYHGAKMIQHERYYKSDEKNRSELVDILQVTENFKEFLSESIIEYKKKEIQRYDISSLKKIQKYYSSIISEADINNDKHHTKFYSANSIHHQGIKVIKTEENNIVVSNVKNIQVVAYNPLFMNLEAAFFSNKIAGVQYHPEETDCPVANKIINCLLNN